MPFRTLLHPLAPPLSLSLALALSLPLLLSPLPPIADATGVWGAEAPAGWTATTFGRVGAGDSESGLLTAWLTPADIQLDGNLNRVMLVARGAGGAKRVAAAVTRLGQSPLRNSVAVSAAFSPDWEEGAFPPGDPGYQGSRPEIAHLWRWIGIQAPDLVIVVTASASGPARWRVPTTSFALLQHLSTRLSNVAAADDRSLEATLCRLEPAGMGSIPAIQVAVSETPWLDALLSQLAETKWRESPARAEQRRRLHRSPQQVRRELGRHYGRRLADLQYIESLAVIARIRGAESDEERTEVVAAAREWVASRGLNDAAPLIDRAPTNGSQISGRLLLCELARQTPPAERAPLLRAIAATADLAFDPQGQLLESMPFHIEMSDSIFMAGPLLAEAGALLGDSRYFDACLQHVRFMRKRVLREDGLYRHSPLNEAAWGRGNGFPALGIAWCVQRIPETHPAHQELRAALLQHLRVLARHQTVDGAWRQVIDQPGAYRELTSTCMILWAMQQASREGWGGEEEFSEPTRRAWRAVQIRAGGDGRLIDVCTGTGKQRRLEDYYLRAAILGPDARGGAMVLMAATAMPSHPFPSPSPSR